MNPNNGRVNNFQIPTEGGPDDNDDSEFECSDRPKCKSVHVEIDKEMAQINNKLIFALLPNRSEEDAINNNGETQDRDGDTNLRRSNRVFKPVEPLDSVQCF